MLPQHKVCQIVLSCKCQMMGQINPEGFQSPMCMFYVYVIVEIKYFWLWKKNCFTNWIPREFLKVNFRVWAKQHVLVYAGQGQTNLGSTSIYICIRRFQATAIYTCMYDSDIWKRFLTNITLDRFVKQTKIYLQQNWYQVPKMIIR